MRTLGTLNRPVTERMLAFVKDWLGRRELRRSLDRMDARDLEKISSDSGFCAGDLAYIARTPFLSEDLLSPMMHRFGLEPKALASSEPQVVRDLQRICTLCPSRSRCRRGLARDDAAAARGYCPNAATFDALAAGVAAYGRRQ